METPAFIPLLGMSGESMQHINGRDVVDEEDQCFSCKFYSNVQTCPLISALGCAAVVINGDGFLVKGCGWYEGKTLRRIK